MSGERSLHEFADACMDEWKRLCSHAHTEDRVTSSLEETGLLARMKGAVCREVVKPSVEMGGVEKTVFDAVANSSECSYSLGCNKIGVQDEDGLLALAKLHLSLAGQTRTRSLVLYQ